MKFAGPFRHFEAIAAHNLQAFFPQARAVSREQDAAVAVDQFQSLRKKVLKIAFHMKCPAAVRSRKGWWIKNDHIELLTFPRESRKDDRNIVSNEPMVTGRKTVQSEILAATFERLL